MSCQEGTAVHDLLDSAPGQRSYAKNLAAEPLFLFSPVGSGEDSID